VVHVDYPKEVERGTGRPDGWGWYTIFKETGGRIPYRVTGKGAIYDPAGGRWISYGISEISRGPLRVPTGGEQRDYYWCASNGPTDHRLCNGDAVFTWSGEDAGGNPVTVTTKVHLKHTGCPGAQDGKRSSPQPK
jgi:hypothetical protein